MQTAALYRQNLIFFFFGLLRRALANVNKSCFNSVVMLKESWDDMEKLCPAGWNLEKVEVLYRCCQSPVQFISIILFWHWYLDILIRHVTHNTANCLVPIFEFLSMPICPQYITNTFGINAFAFEEACWGTTMLIWLASLLKNCKWVWRVQIIDLGDF